MIVGIYNAIADSRVRRDWRWLALVRIARWLLPGHRLIWPQMAWWQDRDFNAYLQKFGLLSSHESERRWMLQACREGARRHGRVRIARGNPGGIIVIDDYGFTNDPGAAKACSEFLSDKPAPLISLPCGGAFLVRQ